MANVTVNQFTIPNYRWGGATAKLRLYADRDFTDSAGVPRIHGTAGSATGFYQEVNLTISSNTVTVPEFITVSTEDALPLSAPKARITAVLFDSKGVAREKLFEGWSIPTTSPTTFLALRVLNLARTLPNPPATYLNRAEVEALIAAVSAPVNGSGTGGRVAKWSDSDTLAASILNDDGTTVTVSGPLVGDAQFSTSGNASIGSPDVITHRFQVVNSVTNKQTARFSAAPLTPDNQIIVSAGRGDELAWYVSAGGNLFTTSMALRSDGTNDYVGSTVGRTLHLITNNTSRVAIGSGGGMVVGGSTLDGSAIFQVDSTTLGLLPPRMTTAQRDAIVSPANGLLLYNTTDGAHQARQNGVWVSLGASGGVGDNSSTGSVGIVYDSDSTGTGEFTVKKASTTYLTIGNSGSFDLDPSYTDIRATTGQTLTMDAQPSANILRYQKPTITNWSGLNFTDAGEVTISSGTGGEVVNFYRELLVDNSAAGNNAGYVCNIVATVGSTVTWASSLRAMEIDVNCYTDNLTNVWNDATTNWVGGIDFLGGSTFTLGHSAIRIQTNISDSTKGWLVPIHVRRNAAVYACIQPGDLLANAAAIKGNIRGGIDSGGPFLHLQLLDAATSQDTIKVVTAADATIPVYLLSNVGSLAYGASGTYGFINNTSAVAPQVRAATDVNLYVAADTGKLSLQATNNAISGGGASGRIVMDLLGSIVNVMGITGVTATTGLSVAGSGAASAPVSFAIGGGTAITFVKKGTVTIDPASIAGTTFAVQTFTLTGAVVGDTVVLSPPAAGLTSGIVVGQPYVSAADTVAIPFYNTTGGAIDLASASWTYMLVRI